jgi:hypothetical protein
MEPKLAAALSEAKRLFRLFRFYTERESFSVSIEPKQTEEQPKQFEREHSLVFFSENVGLFRFVTVCFETVCLVCFASIVKQRVSMFRLNQNKQMTKRNSFIESIVWYFFQKMLCCFRLFRFVSKQSVLVVLLQY